VYHIWRQRNDLKPGKQLKAEEKILHSIASDVKTRVMVKGSFKQTRGNLELCSSWGLPFASEHTVLQTRGCCKHRYR
jgi:hypothetical protein